jgi:hypothetical protein
MQVRRNLSLVPLALVLSAAATWAQPVRPPKREDVVAVVLEVSQPYRGTLTISYPTPVGREQITRDLAAIETASGWKLSPPGISNTPRDTQVTVVMRPAAQPGPYGDPVWPLVSALRRFNRVTVVVLGPAYRGTEQSLDNRFVHCVVSPGKDLWSYDVTIKDRGFASVVDLRARPPEPSPPAQPPPPPPRPRSVVGWWAVAIAAGLSAYLLALWWLQGRDPQRREQARRMALRRARRARNMF